MVHKRECGRLQFHAHTGKVMETAVKKNRYRNASTRVAGKGSAHQSSACVLSGDSQMSPLHNTDKGNGKHREAV